MTNLRFRVWNEKEKRMIYSDEFVRGFYEFFEQACSDESQAMQYSGLEDKNGKSIYECDIVRVQIGHETNTSYVSLVWLNSDGFQVDSHPAHIKMDLKDCRLLSDYCGRYSKECEIIGNYFENEELLKCKT